MVIIIYDQGERIAVETPDSDLPLWALAEMCREAQSTKERETK